MRHHPEFYPEKPIEVPKASDKFAAWLERNKKTVVDRAIGNMTNPEVPENKKLMSVEEIRENIIADMEDELESQDLYLDILGNKEFLFDFKLDQEDQDEIEGCLSQLIENKTKYHLGILEYDAMVDMDDELHQNISDVIKMHDPRYKHLNREERREAVRREKFIYTQAVMDNRAAVIEITGKMRPSRSDLN